VIDRDLISGGADTDCSGEERSSVLIEPAELKDIHVLQKEVAALGKKQAETREVDLAIVHLCRGKVGVDRERAVQ